MTDGREKVLSRGGFDFYGDVMSALGQAGIRFLTGGAYALHFYTGIERHTKDLDLFLREADLSAAMSALAQAGVSARLSEPHWIAKAEAQDDGFTVDLIFNSGNGITPVDDLWFEHARRGLILGRQVAVCPAEEMIWTKAFVMERERYDGADIMHLLHACSEGLDWARLLRRFGGHFRVLLHYLVLFGYVYPAKQGAVPEPVMSELFGRIEEELAAPPVGARACLGTLLSNEQYIVDVERWGYEDARVRTPGATFGSAGKES